MYKINNTQGYILHHRKIQSIFYIKKIFADVQSLSHVQLFATPRTIAHQAPLPMGSSRQEYWSGLPCPFLGDFFNPGIEPVSLTSTCVGRQVLYHESHLGSPLWLPPSAITNAESFSSFLSFLNSYLSSL